MAKTAVKATEKKITREQAAAKQRKNGVETPKQLSMKDFPVDELNKMLEEALERVVKKSLKKNIDNTITEEWEKVKAQSVHKIAKEIIGDDYWEVINIAKRMAHGEQEFSISGISETLMQLGGYHSSISAASAILRAQYKEHFAKQFMKAKGAGHTDGTSEQMATYSCSNINYQHLTFSYLRESTLELINLMKVCYKAAMEEYKQVTPVSQ